MQTKSWMLKEPIDFFFFDCDSTLSLIEGIDILATQNSVASKVHEITERCMANTGLNIDDYRERLNLVCPTKKQIDQLALLYNQHTVSGAYEVIRLLHHLNKKVYIISSGIKAAIIPFAQALGIKPSEVLAVDIYFDKQGRYIGFDENSHLVHPYGKAIEIRHLFQTQQRTLLLGDGISDLETKDIVTRFIGFSGLNSRELVKKHADFYINTTNIYSILPLGLTSRELKQLSSQDQTYYQKGLTDIQNSFVFIRGH